MDPIVRRALLGPLRRRKREVTSQKGLISALERLYERGVGERLLAKLGEVLKLTKENRASLCRGDPESTGKSVALAKALFASRRISKQEYVFLASSPVESLNDANVINGDLDAELQPISDAMNALQESHDAVWLKGEGPKEYWDLSKKFDQIVEKRLIKRLREFRLEDLAQLRESDC